ncbi:olfactory receptor 4D2-like [Lepisosteus oculatus]|uniref:olfactory receptor 4D2-like n=1 Tax=Lepisosteus oculatus TaxID=7918 RepID=UPI00371D13D8
MENGTINVMTAGFSLAGFDLTPEGVYLTVVIGIIIYLFSVFCNLSLLVLIATDKHLHEPMYLFLFNLSVNDLIGISAVIPRAIMDLVSIRRKITFPFCLIQAFCVHMYGGATLLILAVMAFDRYIAICHPLRYHTIISGNTVTKLIVFVWVFDFVLISTLFALLLRFPFCRTVLSNFYCENSTLLLATCAEDTSVNNIYGLLITGFLHAIGIFSVVFTYGRILSTCLRSKESESKTKALYTCATHLLAFLIYEFSSLIIILAYRFPQTPLNLRRFMGMSFVIFPPVLNPVIYGIKTKEIKNSLRRALVIRYFL